MVTKRELSNTAKLSVFKSVFIPILTYGHESWVKTENIISGASGRDGIFAKSPRHNTGAYRGEMAIRARNKFGASCSSLRLFRKCTVLKKNLRHYWDLSEPPSHPVHGESPCAYVKPPICKAPVCLFPRSLHPWFDTLRPSALLLNSQSPECRTTCQNSEITATL